MIKRLLFGIFISLTAGTSMAVEEPEYTVTEASDPYELRAYTPLIVAETVVSGSMDEASTAGFKLIADYIFGNNTSRSGSNEKISMTAPVTMEPKSEEINMTAPVSIKRTGKQWRVHFVMPSEYTLDSLPKPNNPAVTIREIPARNYAVIRFSGFAGEEKVAVKNGPTAVMAGKQKHRTHWQARTGTLHPPPWTLPFLRRNEVLVRYN